MRTFQEASSATSILFVGRVLVFSRAYILVPAMVEKVFLECNLDGAHGLHVFKAAPLE